MKQTGHEEKKEKINGQDSADRESMRERIENKQGTELSDKVWLSRSRANKPRRFIIEVLLLLVSLTIVFLLIIFLLSSR